MWSASTYPPADPLDSFIYGRSWSILHPRHFGASVLIHSSTLFKLCCELSLESITTQHIHGDVCFGQVAKVSSHACSGSAEACSTQSISPRKASSTFPEFGNFGAFRTFLDFWPAPITCQLLCHQDVLVPRCVRL